MTGTSVHDGLGAAALDELHDLVARTDASGAASLSDATRIQLLRHPERMAAVIAHDGVGRADHTVVVAPRDDASTMELLGAGPDDSTAALVREALQTITHRGGGRVDLWIHGASPAWDEMLAGVGFRPNRDLHQLRRRLPLQSDGRPPLPTRPFRPGFDEAAFVTANNAAFAGHVEQGRWSVDDVVERESEPWFDAAGFLLHEIDGEIAAFCWTKVHDDEPSEPVGEIYVIGVHPNFQSRGLGRAIVEAGCASLARRGLGEVMLYVAAENTSARGLYGKLGFRLDHIERAYITEIEAAR